MDEIAVEGPMRADPGHMTLVGGGKVDAFAELTTRHLDQAYRLAWAILGNDQEAQDATQDALTVAWRERRRLRDPDKLEAWFSRILINRCRDLLRSRARSRVQPLDLARLPWVADDSQAAVNRDELGRALESLNPDQRIVVVLRFWADLTVDDIADRLGVPAGTVKSRLHNSLHALRATLEDPR
jgi:RNA polymerase sigma-70 factor (ECF subfamily)